MALPLPALTFVRMADVNPAGTGIHQLLDAIFAAGSALTDYRGTSLPSTHCWTWTKRQVAGPTTEAVTVTPPAGTAMGKTPALVWAGRAVVSTPTPPTPAAPDVMFNSLPFVGINKNGGSYASWDAALPFTSGQFYGYWGAGYTTLLAANTIVRVYISQETIFLQMIVSPGTAQSWNYVGAIVEPYDNDTMLSGETDNRLYGIVTSGRSGAVSNNWLSFADMFTHNSGSNVGHAGVFTPGAGTIASVGRLNISAAAGSVANTQTPSGVYAAELMPVAGNIGSQTPTGSRMGTFRGIYPVGLVQSGRYLRNGSTDLYHLIATNIVMADDGLMLPAVP